MQKQKLLISSCLLGELVKYNGSHNLVDNLSLEKLQDRYELFSICPEMSGGLPSPRPPAELIDSKVIGDNGVDFTKEFFEGANITLELCKKEGIKIALLKQNSPSCSNDYIYDGTFSHTKIEGQGIAAKLLEQNDIKVFNETQIDKLCELV